MAPVRRRRFKRQVKGGWNIGRDVKSLAALGASMASQLGGSGTATTSQRKSSEMAPLTSEKDVRTVYRKRRMPRRRKRRFLKRIKQFKSLQLRTEPSRIFQYVQAYSEDAGINTSNYFGCFYGLVANDAYSNSLRKVYGQFTDGVNADQKAFASHLRIDHMSITTVIRNVSTPTAGQSGTIDLDVYKVVCIRDVPLALWPDGTDIQAMIQTMGGRLNTAKGADIEVNDAGTGIAVAASGNVNAVGSMLWNIPTFLRYFKIIKQFKIQLGVGQVVQLNMRTSKNKRVSYEECQSTGTSGRIAARAYLTAGYIFNENGRWNRAASGWEEVKLETEQYTRYNIKPLLPTQDTYVYN